MRSLISLLPLVPRGATSLAAAVGLASLLFVLGGCQNGPEPPVAPAPERAVVGPPVFEDVTASSGVKVSYRNGKEANHYAILESLGGGVALIDYDGDGLLDIFVPGGGYYAGPDKQQIKGHPCKLYKNLGNFQFKDVTAEVFPQQPNLYTHGAAVVDYDRDGWPDLLVTGYGRVELYRNVPVDPKDPKKGRRFALVTKEAGLTEGLLGKHFWATSAAFGDLDGDGFPDLYVCQYANWSWQNNPPCPGYTSDVKRDVCPPKQFTAMPHALYHNVPVDPQDPSKGRKFVDVTRAAGIRIDRADHEHGKGLGVVIVDVNGDGKPDIYVANDTVDNFLYLNRSKPGLLKFDEVGLEVGVARDDRGVPNGSMGTDAGDPFGSGLASLWCTNYEGELHALYRNVRLPNGRHTFLYNTQAAGIGAIGTLYVGFGTNFVDVDNDGWEDLVIVNGHVIRHPKQCPVDQKMVLLLNKGKGRFVDASRRGGDYFQTPRCGRGLAVGDLNNDGRPDLVVSTVNQPVGILRNVAPARAWLGVELAGRDRRDVVGAKLTLQVGDRKLTRFAKGGGSYLSAGDPRVLFGLGEAGKAGRLTVEWPSGEPRVQHYDGLTVNRYHRLVQGDRSEK
jgi:hypothetical protein